MTDIFQLSLGFAVAYFILRLVFDFIKSLGIFKFMKDPDHENMNRAVQKINQATSEMYEWMSLADSDGVKLMYRRKGLEDAIEKLSQNLTLQTQTLHEMTVIQKQMLHELRRLQDDVDEIRREN